MSSGCSLLELPLEILVRIFCFLASVDVARSSPVCKLWNESINHSLVWKSLFHSRFGVADLHQTIHQLSTERYDYKYAYKQDSIIARSIMDASRSRQYRAEVLASPDLQLKHIFCSFFGEPHSGKTSLCYMLANQSFLNDYIPTLTEDRYTVLASRGAQRFSLQLCDSGQDWSPARVRNELGAGAGSGALRCADVLALVFDVTHRDTLVRLCNYWAPLLQRCCPSAPLLLVGTMVDRRSDPPAPEHITITEARDVMQELHAQAYVECSARTYAAALSVLEGLVRIVCPQQPAAAARADVARPRVYEDVIESDDEELSE